MKFISFEKIYGGNPEDIRTTPFDIFVNQAGYYKIGEKKAVIPFRTDKFSVTDMNGKTCYEGRTIHFGYDENSGDDVYIADFSELTRDGEYRIEADGKYSARFSVSENPFRKLFFDISKAFYYQRCGCALTDSHAGEYVHEKCHFRRAMLWDDNSVTLDVSGGWHDAGDYGRYVTAGACALAHLLYAYMLFPKAFDKLKLNIPESGNRTPDILNECRVELEWMMKMQRGDGAVYHKATTAHHAPFVMPEDDTAQMFVLPVSSMAAADFAAVCALASRVYKKFDKTFSNKLSFAAEKSYAWLKENPFIGFQNPDGCNTGGYGERDDYSNRFWAAAEMYALTGNDKRRCEMMASLEIKFPMTALGYGEVGGFGMLACLTSRFDIPDSFREYLLNSLKAEARRLSEISDGCGYGAAMTAQDYHWGSNMCLMQHGMIFAAADIFCGADYRKYAVEQVNCLLGKNALGISYVTGSGEFRCNNPHLRTSAADGIEECIPGMVSGGPNGRPADPSAGKLIREGTPPMKCYADDVGCYSLNEITIYWNSPAVFVLAYLAA